jgi:hypothetical protein
MKNILKTAILLLLMSAFYLASFAQQTGLKVSPRQYYKYRDDGKAGREVLLSVSGAQISGDATVVVTANAKSETTQYHLSAPVDSISVLLPDGMGVDKEDKVSISLSFNNKTFQNEILLQPHRKWTVYIYPHAHVDIGYTTTQEKVKKIHFSNIENAIALAEKTAGYPEGSRYKWNVEASWAVTDYLKQTSNQKRERVFNAVRKGWLCIDGTYANINTSCASDEELLRLFHYSKDLAKECNTNVNSMVQMDIPGASWGTIAAASQNGIKYFFSFPNPLARIGWIREGFEYNPFWWVAPDGKSKILYYQAWPYSDGFQLKGVRWHMELIHGHPEPIKTDNPSSCFIDKDDFIYKRLTELEKRDNYPYDIFVLSWCLCDNGPIDADLPDAVKLWNEKYAYPKLIIAGASEIGSAFEKRYGNILPERKGDITEYWTDGAGSDARVTAMNRKTKGKLSQTEILCSMLNKDPGKKDVDEAWRYVLLGTEHTWSGWDPPSEEGLEISRVKTSYFETARQKTDSLYNKVVSTISDNTGNNLAVFNTFSWKRTGLVYLKNNNIKSIKDEKNNKVPYQITSDGELVFIAKDIPAMGVKNYKLEFSAKKSKVNNSTFVITKNSIDNGIVKVTVDVKSGDVCSIISKGKEFVKGSVNSYRYLYGDDMPEKAIGTSDVKISIKENGPVVASVLVESNAEGCKKLLREIRIYKDLPNIDFVNTLDKLPIVKKEGVHFGFSFNVPDCKTKLDIPLGIMQPEVDQLPGANRNWLAVQHWTNFSNDSTSVTWSTPDVPLVEIGKISANIVGDDKAFNPDPHRSGARMLNTIPESESSKFPWFRFLQNKSVIYSWVMNNHWNTNFPRSQSGILTFRYGMLAQNSKYNVVSANRFGFEQSQPLISVQTEKPLNVEFPFAIDNPNVFISSVKPSDDGKATIIRLRSVSDKSELIILKGLPSDINKIHYCNEAETANQNFDGKIMMLPYGIIGLRIEKQKYSL